MHITQLMRTTSVEFSKTYQIKSLETDIFVTSLPHIVILLHTTLDISYSSVSIHKMCKNMIGSINEH